MTRWTMGEVEILALLASNDLQSVVGDAANGLPLAERARATLATAESISERDPDSAYVLAYDACRLALAALLAQQGLRATSKGGHYAIEQAVRAQFGAGFRQFGALRRRRHDIEYPRPGGTSDVTATEISQALASASDMIAAARALMDEVDMF